MTSPKNNRHAWSAKRTIRPAQSCLKLWTHILTFKRPKNCMKMAVLMLPLPTEVRENNTFTDPRCPTYLWNYSRKIGFIHRDKEHRQRRGDRKISNGKGSLGHWLLQSQPPLFQLWTWSGHAVSNQFRVFDVTPVALLVKQGTFPI